VKIIYSDLKNIYNFTWDSIETQDLPHPNLIRLKNCELFILNDKLIIHSTQNDAPLAISLFNLILFNFNSTIISIAHNNTSLLNLNVYEISAIYKEGFIEITFNSYQDANSAFVMYYITDSYNDNEYFLNLEIKRWDN